MRSSRSATLLLPLLATAGCITHVPPTPNLRHGAVDWAPSWAAATQRAAATDRPLLLIAAAGPRDGAC